MNKYFHFGCQPAELVNEQYRTIRAKYPGFCSKKECKSKPYKVGSLLALIGNELEPEQLDESPAALPGAELIQSFEAKLLALLKVQDSLTHRVTDLERALDALSERVSAAVVYE